MMRSLLTIVFACIIFAFVSSCGRTKSSVNMLSEYSLEGEWNILKVDGEDISMKTKPWIGFDIKRHKVYGFGGCNRFFGNLDLDSLNYGLMSFHDIASTKSSCPDIKIENIILDAIENVAFYKTDSDKPDEISLFSRDSINILLLEKRAIVQPELSELSGEWVIESAYGKRIEATAEIAPFIGIDTDESRIYGNVGCNTINGILKQDSTKANSIIFKNIATTNMLCASMETEKIVLECLNAARSFKKTDDGEIILYNGMGDELLVLKKE